MLSTCVYCTKMSIHYALTFTRQVLLQSILSLVQVAANTNMSQVAHCKNRLRLRFCGIFFVDFLSIIAVKRFELVNTFLI